MAKLTLGSWVRQRREAAGLTREQLAAKAGTSTSTVTRLERHSQAPKAPALVGIATALEVSVDDLLALVQ